jgi:putative DNA methylase
MYRKKLIEVALPLEAINKASAKEKSIRHGHPATLHLWWARRPLAACRAVLFASVVDDPSGHPERFPTETEQEKERERLFGIIERLVVWENANNKAVLDEAKAEIAKSTGGDPPTVYDPFCGGGSIPLEAQRLGLEAQASDLNPVAVLITKALIEIPSKFANQAPVNPESRKSGMQKGAYPGALGLAADIRYYGGWVRKKALERIGHLYPPVKLKDGTEVPVVAWIWARTVQCPNPACQAQMPLVRNFQLSSKEGKEVSVHPKVDQAKKTVSFEIRTGAIKVLHGTVNRKGARCIVCGTSVKFEHIRAEAKVGRMSAALMAIVVDGKEGRGYTEPDLGHVAIANQARPPWVPETDLPEKALGFRVQAYGMTKHKDLFTPRQLTALATFSDLIPKVHSQLIADGATQEFANAVVTYLAFAVDKMADTNCSLCSWQMDPPRLRATFGRQTLSMTWDYAEAGIFADAAGDYGRCVGAVCEVIERLRGFGAAWVAQLDACAETSLKNRVIVATDPPYYDNIGYADLSDFFYVWLRRALFSIYPELFSTLLVPKTQELIATPFRFGGDSEKAREFFESGFGKAMERIRRCHNADYPITVFYAFKQSETEEDIDEGALPSLASTGWETMLEGLLHSDLQITGTWPMRSELASRNRGRDANALASSIVLACRPRPAGAQLTTRKDFLACLKKELAPAIRTLQMGNIAPVDLQQAAIGPGMSIFSRYAKVIESDGSAMRVRIALGLINQVLDEVLSEQESDYDSETRWALTWFEQNQFNEGTFGEANVLASAKALSVEGMQNAGLLLARAGKVRLLRREELPTNWYPSEDKHLTVWKVTQQLIHRLATQGQDSARDLAGTLGGLADTARELAYRLYTLCERKGWAEEAGFYNALVIAWPAIRSREFALTGDN